VNVGDIERVACVVGGGMLVVMGLSESGTSRLILPALGGLLAYRGFSGHCPVYESAGISTAAQHGLATSVPAGHGYKTEESVFINRPASELYGLWRQFDHLPRFMKNLKSVEVLNDKRSRWTANGPLGTPVSWEAEIINERPNELIAWRSVEGSTVDTAGSVHFQPTSAGHGTEVHVSLKYNPPGGKLGATASWLLGAAPEQQLREDLQRFKQFAESGQLASSGQSSRR